EVINSTSLNITPLTTPNTLAKFDFTLNMFETEDGLASSWDYRTDLFEETTIRKMGAHFERMLQGIIKDPTQGVYDIQLLSEAETHQLIYEWNDTKEDYPENKCIHELFEIQVEKAPDRTAIVFEDTSLTYGELNAQSNRLAHYLMEQGVKPDTLVGLCVERSLDMIVGLMGILKSGGAYVPIDPDYPLARIKYMLKDSGIHNLITQNTLIERLKLSNLEKADTTDPADKLNITLFSLDATENRELLQNYPAINPDALQHGVTANHLAYVIYTSGSTGQPKGVEIEHHSVVADVQFIRDYYQVSESDRALLFASLGFDASVEQIFSPLSRGAVVYIRGEEVWSAEEFYNRAEKNKFTIVHVPPQYLSALVTDTQEAADFW
ncbi:MAG: AMP-binding protein, partial [candidate division Zixibacteria bacterium]|nr:AMP-binding protein [candidate division Zixibacteria bacterium]